MKHQLMVFSSSVKHTQMIPSHPKWILPSILPCLSISLQLFLVFLRAGQLVIPTSIVEVQANLKIFIPTIFAPSLDDATSHWLHVWKF
jgi:hypothetical protein